MAAGSSEAASVSREFTVDDLADLSATLHKVSTKYRFFGLQIGLKMHEISEIEVNHSKSADRLLDVLFTRLNLEPAISCADIVKALRSPDVGEGILATEFQKQFESKGSSKKNGVEKVSQSHAPLRMSEKGSQRGIVADESKSNESENIHKAEKSAELERQVCERDEPKSKNITCEKGKSTRMEYSCKPKENAKHEEKLISSEMAASPQSGAELDQENNKSSEKSQPEAMTKESDSASSFACKEKAAKSEKMGKARIHSELKPHQSELVSNGQVRNEARENGKEKSKTQLQRKAAIEQASDESQTDSENEESDLGNDSSEDGEDSEGRSSDEEYSTALSDFEEDSVFHEKKETKKKSFKENRKVKKKSISKAAVELSKYYDSPVKRFDETCTGKLKGTRESGASSLKYYDSPDQSDPGHDSRDQEEHDIQKKKRNKKKQRRESSMSPTAIESSSPSTSQEEKKKQPVSKKQGHRKKHVRKMKEKSGCVRYSSVQKRKEVKNRRKGTLSSSSETDSSSPECDLTQTEKRRIRKIFKCAFGKLCCTNFDPAAISVLLQGKDLISQEVMKEMIVSPESQQAKIISLVTALDKRIKSRPDKFFLIIEVLLESDALQEAGTEMLKRAGE